MLRQIYSRLYRIVRRFIACVQRRCCQICIIGGHLIMPAIVADGRFIAAQSCCCQNLAGQSLGHARSHHRLSEERLRQHRASNSPAVPFIPGGPNWGVMPHVLFAISRANPPLDAHDRRVVAQQCLGWTCTVARAAQVSTRLCLDHAAQPVHSR